MAFVGIFTGFNHRSLKDALLRALIVEAAFIVIVGVFVGGVLLLLVKARPRR